MKTTRWDGSVPYPRRWRRRRVCWDECHNILPSRPQDSNNYTFGRVGDHNVVIVCLPSGVTGAMSAAKLATQMLSIFTRLRLGIPRLGIRSAEIKKAIMYVDSA